MDTKQAEELRKEADDLQRAYTGRMRPEEVEFLEDMKGFIDYCIANGMSFAMALLALAHDVNGVLHYGASVREALGASLKPRAAGFAGYDSECVGEPEEVR